MDWPRGMFRLWIGLSVCFFYFKIQNLEPGIVNLVAANGLQWQFAAEYYLYPFLKLTGAFIVIGCFIAWVISGFKYD
jgi:hypothetical protein